MNANEVKNAYLSAFPDWEKAALSKDPFWLRETREKALAAFGEAGFPTTKDEFWKFTDLDPFYKLPFDLTGERPAKAAVLAELKSLGFEPEKADLMVFVNGHFSKELSHAQGRGEGHPQSLIENLANGPLKREFAHILPFENRPFAALNYAYFTDGLFLKVPQGKKLEKPIHAVYLSINTGHATQSHLRNLILMEEGSEATLVEHYWGNNLKPYFTNSVTKVSMGPGAVLHHAKIQQESPLAFHIGVVAANQEEGSRLVSRTFSLGGSLGRSEVETALSEKNSECLLEGLYLAKGKQHLDHRTFIDHLAPSCKSEEIFNGVVDGEATGIFDGHILVRENAQKTDARQSNKNLQLSNESKVFSKPQLRIYADDVKCSHGSATGQLDEEALFYLQSRGLGREEARKTLVTAFAGEMVDRVTEDYLQAPLRRLVEDWMGGHL
jgi:Fe-S cluster assembly protein SufD